MAEAQAGCEALQQQMADCEARKAALVAQADAAAEAKAALAAKVADAQARGLVVDGFVGSFPVAVGVGKERGRTMQLRIFDAAASAVLFLVAGPCTSAGNA